MGSIITVALVTIEYVRGVFFLFSLPFADVGCWCSVLVPGFCIPDITFDSAVSVFWISERSRALKVMLLWIGDSPMRSGWMVE